MAAFAFVNHLLFAVCLFAISTGLTWLMIRASLMSLPNHRSSHSNPVPNSGGVAIVVTFIIGFVAVNIISDDARLSAPYMAGFALACAGIALVSSDQVDRTGPGGGIADFLRYILSACNIAAYRRN